MVTSTNPSSQSQSTVALQAPRFMQVVFVFVLNKEIDPIMYNDHNSFCKAILISWTAKENSLRNTVITFTLEI